MLASGDDEDGRRCSSGLLAQMSKCESTLCIDSTHVLKLLF